MRRKHHEVVDVVVNELTAGQGEEAQAEEEDQHGQRGQESSQRKSGCGIEEEVGTRGSG